MLLRRRIFTHCCLCQGLAACRSCELLREFTEEAHCIALHPSGYNLLVGFTDKLRLFAVLVDSLK